MKLRPFSQLGWFALQMLGAMHLIEAHVVAQAWVVDAESEKP